MFCIKPLADEQTEPQGRGVTGLKVWHFCLPGISAFTEEDEDANKPFQPRLEGQGEACLVKDKDPMWSVGQAPWDKEA